MSSDGEHKNTSLTVESLQKAFLMIDVNGDGFLSRTEVDEFLTILGDTPSDSTKGKIYNMISDPQRGELVDKFVFEDFETLLSVLSNDSSCNNNDEVLQEKGMKLFSQMDTDGDDCVSGIEVMNWLIKNGVESDFGTVAAIMKYFDSDGDGHITLEELISKNQERQLGNGMAYFPGKINEIAPCLGYFANNESGTTDKRKSLKKKSDIAKFLDELIQMDKRSIDQIEDSRWAGFVNFERKVYRDKSDAEGEVKTVMVGSDEVTDVLPGQHHYRSVFGFDDLIIKPNFTEIKGVQWISNQKTGKGTLKFPSNFDGLIAIDIGTGANLSYYGATLTNTRPDDTITLSMRHVIQDFTYSDNYLEDYVMNVNGNNGAGLERHGFTHLDCPLDSDNGTFVIGKFIDNDETILHLTGFRIPARHCMLLPGNIIHCNDYLKGTWRTMLSDAAPIDYVYLEKEDNRFHFKFSK